MELNRMIAELRQQRETIENAIRSLEVLSAGGLKRRGRPPAWLTAQRSGGLTANGKRRGRPPGSTNKAKNSEAAVTETTETTETPQKSSVRTFTKAQRKAASERMKARWEAKRKIDKKQVA